jgi:fatty-acyl-CoA synthase
MNYISRIVQSQFSYVNANLIASQTEGVFAEERVFCIAFLMYHQAAFSTVIGGLFSTNCVVVYPSFKFDTIDILESLQDYKCTLFGALPKILLNVINHPGRKNYDLSSLTKAGTAGQLVTGEIIQQSALELGANEFLVFYGATEVNLGFMQTFDLTNFDINKYKNQVGRAAPFTEAKVVDPNTGLVVPLNTEGILHVRNFSVSPGYWRDEELNKKFFSGGWYVTGDFIAMDQDGTLYYKSRCKEIITARGIGK